MKQPLAVLLSGIVDYAGLFPPAALDMSSATRSYANYMDDPAALMLGRFVLPVLRLREFEDAASPLLPRPELHKPWRLSALSGPDVAADLDLALKFNARHGGGSESGHAVIDSMETRASSADEILAVGSVMPPQIAAFFEVPIADDPHTLIGAIKRSGGYAKARTGGVTPDAFPDSGSVARFMMRCRDAGVAFKLTAGLHHPLRAEYRLTYAEDAPRGTMFGYLNMFVAAVLVWNGADEETVIQALLATEHDDFDVSDRAIAFRGQLLSEAVIADARSRFILSFGSCSFREPVDELATLSLA